MPHFSLLQLVHVLHWLIINVQVPRQTLTKTVLSMKQIIVWLMIQRQSKVTRMIPTSRLPTSRNGVGQSRRRGLMMMIGRRRRMHSKRIARNIARNAAADVQHVRLQNVANVTAAGL